MRQRDKDFLDRRDFLRQSTCATLGLTGLAASIANLRLMTAAMAQGGGGSGYKAIVNVFQFGGNDSNNMLVPTNGELRNDYVANRGILALPVNELQVINPANDSRGFGLHPSCPGMASMFNSGKLALVSNVGSLAYPVASRQEYLSGNVPLPPQLFSHSDQQVQWQSSIPDKAFTTGWGGRVADLLNDSYNADSKVSMSISLSGINSFQTGTGGGVVQYAVGPTGAKSLSGYGTAYSAAVNPDGSYKTSWSGRRLKAFDTIMNYAHANLMERAYNQVMKRSRDAEEVVGGAVTAADASGVDFDAIFANAQNRLGDQLKMIAKLIAGRGSLENNRQVFFCSTGGYDTHQDQLSSHVNLMTEFDTALTAFQNAMEALGVSDDVLTFSSSDFTRTFTPNGNDPGSAGSDHGWGGHTVIMGGPVEGGNLYGTFPQLKVNAGDDVNGNRGRWIPSTSVDQYFAVIADWFGVEANAMEAIFPNLGRFEDPFGASANLQFIKTS
jgi:uncharacterized protein (DUF1501 family)